MTGVRLYDLFKQIETEKSKESLDTPRKANGLVKRNCY